MITPKAPGTGGATESNGPPVGDGIGRAVIRTGPPFLSNSIRIAHLFAPIASTNSRSSAAFSVTLCGAPHSVTLNAALLRELVEAIGANKCAIRIEFDKKGGPVLITARPIPSPTGGPFDSVAPPVPGAFGVIMPLTDNGGE